MQDSPSDYSLLLQGIEDGIARSGRGSPRRDENELPPSALKRRRFHSDDEDDDYNPSGRCSLADSRRMAAEVDRLKLVAEEYTAKLGIEQESREREKTRYLRQLEFLEAECLDLKKSLSDKTDKFYEDKRVWQAKVRELEEKCSRVKPSATAASSDSARDSSRAGVEARNAQWEQRLCSLEQTIEQKAAEVSTVKAANINLEADNVKLSQQIKSLKSELERRDDSGSHDQVGNRQKAVFESTIREKNKTIERLERKVEQVAQLQQENVSLQSRLDASTERGSAVTDLQTKLQKLTSEREEWMVLFRHTIKQAKSNRAHADISLDSRAADAHIPMQVLRLLKKTQETAAVSASDLASVETELNAARKKLGLSEASVKRLEEELKEALHKQDKHDSSSSLLKRQSQLFEKEVISLRELLKSFDAEFCIGKPKDTASMFKAKDDMIDSLRRQLDEVRSEASQSLAEVQKLKQTLESGLLSPPHPPAAAPVPQKPAEGTNQSTTISSLREEVEKLRFRLREFQRATGTDHIEAETRVLHLKANPTNGFRGNVGAEITAASVGSKGKAVSADYENLSMATITNEIRQLKEENMRLREAIIMKTEKDSQLNTTVANSSDGNNTSAVNRSTTVDSDKLNMRLKAMFKERISCFREAVYLLTGYKVDLFSTDSYNGSHPRLKLRSMYSEDPDDCLIFQWRGESLELLETPYASTIDPKIFSFLTSCHSVPAFLSNITLELFEKQTFLG